MRIILPSLCLALLEIACWDMGVNVNEDIIPIPKNRSVAEAQQLLVGRWDWAETIVPGNDQWGNGLRTCIQFTASGWARFYQNDTVFSSAVYFVFLDRDSVTIIIGIGNYVPCPFRVSQQYFVTDYRRDGGPVDLYKRQK